MNSKILEVTESEFKSKVLDAQQPVVVEFGADWCRPCKALEPILIKLAGEWGDKAVLMQIDIDQAPQLSQQFMIMSVPTVMLFVNGKPVERLTGLQPAEKLRKKFSAHF